jgi:hypothetical protein
MENLIEGLQTEMNRVREIIKEYESLPGGAGLLASGFMKGSIKSAERAISSGDTVEMLRSYKALQEYEL